MNWWFLKLFYLQPLLVQQKWLKEWESFSVIRSHHFIPVFLPLCSTTLPILTTFNSLLSLRSHPSCWETVWCSWATRPPFTASSIHSLPLSLTFNTLFSSLQPPHPPFIPTFSTLSPIRHLFFLYRVRSPWPANGAWDWLINGCLAALQRQLGNLVRRGERRKKKRGAEEPTVERSMYQYICIITLH